MLFTRHAHVFVSIFVNDEFLCCPIVWLGGVYFDLDHNQCCHVHVLSAFLGLSVHKVFQCRIIYAFYVFYGDPFRHSPNRKKKTCFAHFHFLGHLLWQTILLDSFVQSGNTMQPRKRFQRGREKSRWIFFWNSETSLTFTCFLRSRFCCH